MKLLQTADSTRYVNPDHIISIYIDDYYENGRAICFQVIANMPFGLGKECLFIGSLTQCQEYIEEL